MKKKFNYLIIISVLLTLQACTTRVTPGMLRPSNVEISPKLLNLFNVSSVNNIKGTTRSYFFTIFDKELEDNILTPKVKGKTHGVIELDVVSQSAHTNLAWAMLSGFTFFLSNVIALPSSTTDSSLEVNIKIYDNDMYVIKKYNYFKEDWYINGLYYKNYTKDATSILLMTEIIKDFKKDLKGDVTYLNNTLSNQ